MAGENYNVGGGKYTAWNWQQTSQCKKNLGEVKDIKNYKKWTLGKKANLKNEFICEL